MKIKKKKNKISKEILKFSYFGFQIVVILIVAVKLGQYLDRNMSSPVYTLIISSVVIIGLMGIVIIKIKNKNKE